MKSKLGRYFVVSAGAFLLITAVAKLISSGGSAKLLDIRDAVLGIHFRYLFLIAGTLEMVIGIVCLFGKNIFSQAKLVAWLSVVLLIYRIGLLLLGTSEVCGCLGTLTGTLHISPRIADIIMTTVLGYLLVGSGVTMFLCWKKEQITTEAARLA